MTVHTARRLDRLEEYYFSKKMEEIRRLRNKGHDVINLGIGSPDLPPAKEVSDVLAAAAGDPANHAYQSYRGLPELRGAMADFSQSRFGIALNPEGEVLPLMGSKEGITHISLAFLNAGDQVLMPELAYPTYTSVTYMAEAEPVYFPLNPDNHWAPDWDYLERLDTSRVKLLWINYPHMPTGEKGSIEIMSRFVAYARERNILVCHDNPYSLILNDSPASIFQIPGAMSVALELNSLSKSFNMAGWRIGWVSGAVDHINSILKVKSNMDSGMFKPIQLAAIKALALDESWFEGLNATYAERKLGACRLLDAAGCSYAPDQAGMFLWAKVPTGFTGESFSDDVLSRHDVFFTPGFIFGPAGRDYVRISLCSSNETFSNAMDRIRKR